MTKKQRKLNTEVIRSRRCIIKLMNKGARRYLTAEDAINNRNAIAPEHPKYEEATYEERFVSLQ